MHIESAQEHLRVGKIPSLHFLCFRAWTVFSPTVPAFSLKPSLLLRSLQPFFFSSLCPFAPLAYSTLLFATPFPSSLSATLLLLFFYPSLLFSSLLLFALFYLSRLFFVLLFSSLHPPHYPALLCSSLFLSFLHASIL
jgi:hypothetical protein